MTHLQAPTALQRASLPGSITRAPFTALLGDRSRLRSALLEKRTTIARLEGAWVAAAEADAAAGRGRGL